MDLEIAIEILEKGKDNLNVNKIVDITKSDDMIREKIILGSYQAIFDGMKSAIDEVLQAQKEKDKKIDSMAEWIYKHDIERDICRGKWCTVATTCYPEYEQKNICTKCIKSSFCN